MNNYLLDNINDIPGEAITQAQNNGATSQATPQQTMKHEEVKTVNTDQKPQRPGHDENDLLSIFDELSRNYDKDEIIEPPERVGIFVKRYVNILAGRAGVGKSWQIIRWIRDLSRGGEVFGGVAYNEPSRKCLLIAGELPKREVERRCRLLEAGDGIKRDYNNFIIIDQKQSEARGVSFMLNDEKGRKNIETLINYRKPDIIVLDSFVSLFEGDESKSADVKPVMTFLERIAERYNIAVILVHHIRKRLSRERALPIEQDDIIGSSVLLRKAGFIFASEASATDTKTIRVREIKSWLEPIAPFSYRLEKGFYHGVVMQVNLNDTENENKEPEQTPASQAETYRNTVKTILRARENHTATTKDLREIIGISKSDTSSFKMILQRMLNDKEVIRVGHGVYSLPPDTQTDATQSDNNSVGSVDEDFESE